MAVSARTDRNLNPLRWGLALLLLAGIAWVGFQLPAVPDEPWPEARTYRPDEAVCEAARDARQWTTFEVPRVGGPVTAADVARRFQLEPAPVCRANDVADCGGTRLEPGRRLVLPLSADPAVVAAAREAAGESAGESTGTGRPAGGG